MPIVPKLHTYHLAPTERDKWRRRPPEAGPTDTPKHRNI